MFGSLESCSLSNPMARVSDTTMQRANVWKGPHSGNGGFSGPPPVDWGQVSREVWSAQYLSTQRSGPHEPEPTLNSAARIHRLLTR